MSGSQFLFVNGVIAPPADTPPVSTVLEAYPGAYTTTRTHNNGSYLLFWERHLRRLADSARILLNSSNKLLFRNDTSVVSFPPQFRKSALWDSMLRSLVKDSVRKALPIALKDRRSGEELAITALVSGNSEKLGKIDCLREDIVHTIFDVYVHVGMYIPPLFGIRENAARLAVVGHGRALANAKYSDWVRLRKSLEKLRPPSVAELLLSNDGDQILEGCLTNFFVVCRRNSNADSDDVKEKDASDYRENCSVEIQTASLREGVLPGIIRQVIIDICSKNGILLREVAPQWSESEMWEEAFITNSLRLLQHVEAIQVPSSWKLLESKTWEEVTWEEKQFQEGPGRITSLIQKEIMEKAGAESYPIFMLNGQ